MPATEEGALAAIEAAIANTDGDSSSANTSGSSGETDGATGPQDGGDPGAGAPTGSSAAPEPDGGAGAGGSEEGAPGARPASSQAPDPEADRGDGRNASGRFVKKQGETDEQLAARRATDPQDGKPPAGQPPAAKKADHVNDPIPADVKGRTRERIEGLVATTKELNTKLEAQSAELESGRELFGLIEATGADEQTFARHMEVLGLICSQDPTEQLKAVNMLRSAADKLAQELGEPPAGKDPLEGHPDLIDEVDAGEITRKRAEELAKIRNRDAAIERKRTEATTRNTEQTAAEQAREKLKTALNELTTELRKKDGPAIYARKHAILVPMIRRMHGTMAPDKVVAAVREAYANLELGPAAGSNGDDNRAPAGTGSRQPSRATQGAGGGAKVPTNPMEALEFGLEEHARATGAR